MARRRDESGSMTVLVLGLCVAILMLGALSVDFWRVLSVRRSLAAMADASATAGANGVDELALRRGELALDPSRARSLASAELGREHDAPLVAGAEVDASTTTVDVTLRGAVDVGLFALFGVHDAIPVQVHAAASPRRIP
jgi:Flp pilus assembly protein TadG